MSKLNWYYVYSPYLDPPESKKESAQKAGYIKVVSKSEADKVIAELKKEKEYVIEQTAEVINGQEKELRHHKYKRCLAMAEACMHKRWRTDEGFDYARSHRHMNKWLELAEKFKEAK